MVAKNVIFDKIESKMESKYLGSFENFKKIKILRA